MEIWGSSGFANEAAAAWLEDFVYNDFRLIDRTLAGVANLTEMDELDVWEAAEVVAAAECVAAAAHDLPDLVSDCVANNQPVHLKQEYLQMARQALQRVIENSALQELWRESEHFSAWETAVRDCRQRLEYVVLNQPK